MRACGLTQVADTSAWSLTPMELAESVKRRATALRSSRAEGVPRGRRDVARGPLDRSSPHAPAGYHPPLKRRSASVHKLIASAGAAWQAENGGNQDFKLVH